MSHCPYCGRPAYEHGVFIPESQRQLHIATEAIGTFMVPPFLVWASYQTDNPIARWGLRAIAAGSVGVDGYLLSRWGQ